LVLLFFKFLYLKQQITFFKYYIPMFITFWYKNILKSLNYLNLYISFFLILSLKFNMLNQNTFFKYFIITYSKFLQKFFFKNILTVWVPFFLYAIYIYSYFIFLSKQVFYFKYINGDYMELFFTFFYQNYYYIQKKLFFFNILLLIFSFFISIIHSLNYVFYLKLLYLYFISYPCFNFFSLILVFISIYFSFVILVISDNKINMLYQYIYILLIFPLISVMYIFTNNIILFFYLYELFLLPSIFLVYYLSPNKRSIIAVFYFLIWTQVGSFLIFLFLIIIISYTNVWYLINLEYFYISNFFKRILFILLFFGFGIKIPIWPFYYWLTKTHVEAPTFFSIYLSGFLVKTALYGFYKLFFFLFLDNLIFFFTILLFSVCDVSLKFFSQVDLKKLIAYSTVQEMNLMFIGLLWGTKKSLIYVSLFSLTHTLLSTIFFFLVDVIYKRYYSRSIYNVSGIFVNYPLLCLCIIIACLNYNGFPFSLKFFLEIFLFHTLIEINFLGTIIVLICLNWVGTINFTYIWFRSIFGLQYNVVYLYNFDLLKKELFLFILTFFFFYQYIYILYFLI